MSPHVLHLIWKIKIKIKNQISKSNLKIKIVYNQHGYTAQMWPDTTCVVHRSVDLARGQMLHTHVGEKHPSQDWREVQLHGCPHEIRLAIIEAWNSNR